jgi:pimeloyl-ACP methyl ester carboxylesterase
MMSQMQFRQRFADVGRGITLHYMEHGQGKLVLLVHGFPEFWYEWHSQLQAIGDAGYHAVAVDLRGYNLSSKPQDVESYRTRHLIEDLRALAASITSEPFTMVAHDWGGAVAWAFAMQHPALLDRLVILNSPHPAVFAREFATNPQQQRASQYMRLFQAPEAEAILSMGNFRALKVTTLQGRPAEDVSRYVEAWSQPGALTGGLNYYRAMRIKPPALDAAKLSLPAAESLPDMHVRVPTLVIWGMLDGALTPGNLDGLADYVPNLQIIRVPDATHWIVAEKPDLVNQLILDSLEEPPRNRGVQ